MIRIILSTLTDSMHGRPKQGLDNASVWFTFEGAYGLSGCTLDHESSDGSSARKLNLKLSIAAGGVG
ncbi:MAG: hypothetical protein VKL39_15880 [Leptolyngbyaceae bacterium]|nr:hypothetical protein [Leptolyngbyaceae bacterium]